MCLDGTKFTSDENMILRSKLMNFLFLCSVDRASRYIHLKKSQLDAQFIYSIFRQKSLHVSGVSTAHHQEVHHMDTTTGTHCSF